MNWFSEMATQHLVFANVSFRASNDKNADYVLSGHFTQPLLKLMHAFHFAIGYKYTFAG